MATVHTNKPKTKGGARKILTWQQKLALVDLSVCEDFLAESTCDCGKKCFQRIRQLKDMDGHVIYSLREERTNGGHIVPKRRMMCESDAKSFITVMHEIFLPRV